MSNGEKPGWRADPERPGIQRYWEGEGWSTDIAPRPEPEPAWKQSRVVVIGVLIAAVVIFAVWKMQQPTDLECLRQATAVVKGERIAVDDGCRDR